MLLEFSSQPCNGVYEITPSIPFLRLTRSKPYYLGTEQLNAEPAYPTVSMPHGSYTIQPEIH